MRKILVCGATQTEAGACMAGIKKAGAVDHFEILPTGIGPEKAAESLKLRLARGPKPSLIVSSGFAGSWSPQLDVGTWISAAVISNELGNQLPCQKVFHTATRVTLCSCPEIHETPPKELLAQLSVQGLPIAVDMESFALVQVAQNAAIDCMVLRYITDSPGNPLPGFVRHFTDVAAQKDPVRRAFAFYEGTRSLVKKPLSVPFFLRNGFRWRNELANGWTSFARDF